MKEEIKRIKKEAEQLAQKKSWLVKGVENLLDSMSEVVKDIESDFRIEIDTGIRTPDFRCEKQYILALETRSDAYFEFRTEATDVPEVNERIVVRGIPTRELRKIVANFPETLEKMRAKLEKINGQYQEANNLLQRMLDAVKV